MQEGLKNRIPDDTEQKPDTTRTQPHETGPPGRAGSPSVARCRAVVAEARLQVWRRKWEGE